MREINIEARMRDVLVKMAVISEASGAKLGDIVHGGERAAGPRGPRSSMAEYHARCWRRAKGPVACSEAVQAAEEALTSARYASRANDPLQGTLEWRLRVAQDPRSPTEVARVYKISRQHVYRLRAASGR